MIGVTENDDEIVFLIRKTRNNRLNGEMEGYHRLMWSPKSTREWHPEISTCEFEQNILK